MGLELDDPPEIIRVVEIKVHIECAELVVI